MLQGERHVAWSEVQSSLAYSYRMLHQQVCLCIDPMPGMTLADSRSIACLLFAVQPAGTTYWACEFVSLLLIPWGIDFMVCLGNVMTSNLVEA
jgi:hypothetical protein